MAVSSLAQLGSVVAPDLSDAQTWHSGAETLNPGSKSVALTRHGHSVPIHRDNEMPIELVRDASEAKVGRWY